MKKPNRYENLEKLLGFAFKNKDLLDLAFVHKSFINEYRDKNESNERLEFLGDAVLELAVTEYLYKTYPHNPEGVLTNWRSALVQGKNLALIANELSLGNYLYLSRGEEKSGGRKKNYILANTLEALIGAIYLDHGYKTSHNFISKYILERLEQILEAGLHIDAKSHFQELAQEKISMTPEYKFIKEWGPDHAKRFMMAVYIGDKKVGEGEGSSKQKAEEDAARNALARINWDKLKL
ncbi:ribonuclease III [Candidatus Peregrinibacteria bacterium]|nr:ribonuclease III [Candidatus Peregrinibacteria bacterium]